MIIRDARIIRNESISMIDKALADVSKLSRKSVIESVTDLLLDMRLLLGNEKSSSQALYETIKHANNIVHEFRITLIEEMQQGLIKAEVYKVISIGLNNFYSAHLMNITNNMLESMVATAERERGIKK